MFCCEKHVKWVTERRQYLEAFRYTSYYVCTCYKRIYHYYLKRVNYAAFRFSDAAGYLIGLVSLALYIISYTTTLYVPNGYPLINSLPRYSTLAIVNE